MTPDAAPDITALIVPTDPFANVVYLVYAAAGVALTIWLARTLFKNGEVFLDDVFADNPRMAGAVNRLLVVGFYLLNLGYALLTLRADHRMMSTTDAIETLAVKLGALLLALGALHMGNLYLFHRIRRRAQIRLAPPPVAPHMHTNGAAGPFAPAPVGAAAGPAPTGARF